MSTIEASGFSSAASTALGQGTIQLGGNGLAACAATPLASHSMDINGQVLCEAVVIPLMHLAKGVQVVSAVALTSTKVRVTFDRGMLDDDALIDPANYILHPTTGAGAVLYYSTITPEGISEPTYVDITTSEMTDGHVYDCDVNYISDGPIDPEGTPVDPANHSDLFTGVGVDPTILSVVALDLNTVEVKFNESMKDNSAIRDDARYSFDGGLSVLSVLSMAGDTVVLTTSDQTPGTLYTLTITQP